MDRIDKPAWRLLVCGDRYWTDENLIEIYIAAYSPSVVIEGAARGADTIAHQVARKLKIPILSFPADWKQYGKRAGPIRNKQMLDEGEPTLVFGFHNNLEESKGTKHMLNIAVKAKIKTLHVHLSGATWLCEGE